jgi:hypothetical protein
MNVKFLTIVVLKLIATCRWNYGLDKVSIKFLTRYRPSSFVLSEQGKIIQKKIWDETLEVFRKEAPTAQIPSFEA